VTTPSLPDLICLSHLRWNFVYQRPQHLMARFAKERRVYFVEEPLIDTGPARMVLNRSREGVIVAVPHLPAGMPAGDAVAAQRVLLDRMLLGEACQRFVTWYYTPMARAFSSHLEPLAIAYDCMDELSMFKGAPPELLERERELLGDANVVFTGGQSLYEFKRDKHHNVHPVPSSVDVEHFAKARTVTEDPADQAHIPHPRLGFFGVLDERFDADLVREVARARPDWQIVLVGPVVKIDPASLPRLPNIHYLGAKKYEELPGYIGRWDVALLLFARNDATRFISPTKTPEYLAAGKPVVSTSIRDVVRPYGDEGLVRIADRPAEFVTAVEACLSEDTGPRQLEADAFLSAMSWDQTWRRMKRWLDAASTANRTMEAGESA
jgi:glycosyltransferase involved in cell wall biosynthesis